jgi:hypothetical protein
MIRANPRGIWPATKASLRARFWPAFLWCRTFRAVQNARCAGTLKPAAPRTRSRRCNCRQSARQVRRSLDVAFVTMRMAEGPESQVQLFPENRTSDFKSRFHRWDVSAAKAEIFGGRHRPVEDAYHKKKSCYRAQMTREDATFASPAPTTRQSLNS